MAEQSPSPEPLAPLDEEFEAASAAALSKAREHLERAASLARTSDYPGGYSFLVLALEEASKFVFLKAAAIGVVSFDRSRSPDHVYINARDFTTHPVKHSVFAAIFFARMLLEAAFDLAETSHENPATLTPETVTDLLFRAMEQAIGALPPVGELDPKKQATFYSGDVTPSGEAMRPATREDYRRLRRVVIDQIDFLDVFQSFRVPQSILDETRASIVAYRREHGPAKKEGDLGAFNFARR